MTLHNWEYDSVFQRHICRKPLYLGDKFCDCGAYIPDKLLYKYKELAEACLFAALDLLDYNNMSLR